MFELALYGANTYLFVNGTVNETCKCKCRLDGSNDKERWNEDKCIYKYKELIDKDICDKGSIWNLSNCRCECDKSCDVEEYLDYENSLLLLVFKKWSHY